MPKKGWKSHLNSHKIKKKTRLALIALGLLLILLIFSQFINFLKLISNPLRSEMSKNYTWNGDFNLNIAFRTNPILVASYNPKEKKVTIIRIPDETYIEVPSGFGKWEVRSVYNLGGDKLLKQSLSLFLGIHIDAIASENLVDEFRRNLFSGVTLLPKLKTDLTPLELMRLKLGLLQVRFDKINQIDLLELIVLDKEKLADGTEVFVAEPTRLDSVMGSFAEAKIQSEHLSIAVFNATDEPFLAKMAKRLITNMGGNVIVIQNAPNKAQKSYVEGEKSKTLDRLTQIFDQGCSENTKMLALSERSESKCDKIPRANLGLGSLRAQIIVVLGEDFP